MGQSKTRVWTVMAFAGVYWTGPVFAGSASAPGFSLQRETAHNLPGFYLGGLGAADFDGDGDLDLVISASFDRANQPLMSGLTCVTQTRLFRNVSVRAGAIAFEPVTTFPWQGCRASSVAVADFNNDGLSDFAVEYQGPADPMAVAAVFLQSGSFRFTRVELPGAVHKGNNTAMGMQAVDVDADGLIDLVFNANGNGALPALWYRNETNGSAWAERQVGFHNTLTAGTLAAGDLTGDGYPEIAIGGNAPPNEPFGNVTCSSLNYGHVFANGGAGNPEYLPEPLYEMRADPTFTAPPGVCLGMDNAGMLIADVDGDGANDIITAGSAPGFTGAYSVDFGVQYSLSVLFNLGGGTRWQTWLNDFIPNPWGYGDSNSGAGNEDLANIAAGDMNGDGQLEIFIQGHRRNREGRQQADDSICVADPDGNDANSCVAYYVFDSMLLVNQGNRRLTEGNFALPDVGEGGQVIADFNGDGRLDLIYGGARLPWHSNGRNFEDVNTPASLLTTVLRNVPAEVAPVVFSNGFES